MVVDSAEEILVNSEDPVYPMKSLAAVGDAFFSHDRSQIPCIGVPVADVSGGHTNLADSIHRVPPLPPV